MPENIRIDRIGVSAARITLDRPSKRNALSVALRDEVTEALAVLARDETLKCAVVTGAGDVFSAGFDLSEFRSAAGDAELSRTLWESSDRFHHALLSFPLPLIAAVNGPALAGGFDVAVCCDVRIATEAARFAHPEFAFGDVVYSPLHELVGGAVARDLCLTGRALDAREALALGLVSEVVRRDALDEAVGRVTKRIDGAPRDRLLRTKAKAIARAGITARATLDL
ncbi:MAG: enoyl-CoA hydratase/isomerase family protein [Deltaproteobacteria bacterium]|nr:enoyl-CoA hydratase/isomerase family protein [Deltaproteobacteria bacterium]